MMPRSKSRPKGYQIPQPVFPGMEFPHQLPPRANICLVKDCPVRGSVLRPPWRLMEHMKQHHGWPRKKDQDRIDSALEENAIPTIELEDEGLARQHSQSSGCGNSRDTSIDEPSSADQEKATDRAASEKSSSSTSVDPREEPTPSTDEDFELIAEADDMQALSDSIEYLLYRLDEDLPLPDQQTLLVRTVRKLASQHRIMAVTLDRGLRVAEKVLQQPHPRAKMCAQEHIGYIAHLKSTQGHKEQVKSFFLQIEQLNENPESASRIAEEVLEAQNTCKSRHHYLTIYAERMQTRYLDAPANPEDAIPKWTWGDSDSDTSKGRARKPQMLTALR